MNREGEVQPVLTSSQQPTANSLVIQTAFLGDMVLTTPLIAALARRGSVDVVGTPANVPLLANNPDVRRVYAYSKRASGSVFGLLALGRELRRNHYDAAYLAQGSIRTGTLAVLAGIRLRVGFDTSGGRHLYSMRVPYDDGAHHAERLLQLAGIGGETDPRPRLFPGEGERARVDSILSGAGWPSAFEHRPLIALAPGSVWATKRWPSFPELAVRLAELGRIVIAGSAGDSSLGRAIRERAPTVLDFSGQLTLLEAAELFGRCAAVVSNDSAPVHIASAMNTPTVAIFGPTVPEFGYGPLSSRKEIVGHRALACRPCDRHGPRSCPLGHWRCMRELTVDDVLSALSRLIPASS